MSSSLPIGPAERIAGPYTASAGQTSFTFGFPLLDAADLQVQKTLPGAPDAWTDALPGIDYTLSATLPTLTGGTVVFTSGRTAGTRVRILGRAVIANTADATPGGYYDANRLNRFFDRVTIWAQEVRRDIGAIAAGEDPQVWANRGISQVVSGEAWASTAFYPFLTHNDFSSTKTETHLDTRATMTVTRRATGSGYQSMGASDIGLIVSAEKLNYLTTTAVGELNGLFVIARNGRKSDGAGLLVDNTKVYASIAGDDSGTDGGAIGFEMSSRVVDPAGTILHLGQTLIGWWADERSLAQGYRFHGSVQQSRKGNNHAAYVANSTQPYGAPSNWKYAFLAASAQEQITQYYAVGGDGNEKPGAAYFGPAYELMALWYDQPSNALKFMSGKVVNIDNSTATGSVNLLAASLSRDGDFFVRQSLQLGTGAALKKMLHQDYTLNPGVIAANNTFQIDATLNGVAATDELTVTLGAGYASDKLIAIARYKSTDAITIYIMNVAAAASPSLAGLICHVSARGY
ncbi:hypothetical protein [Ancylobacter sp. SL191]|uniref:hypothetical protein n=1 Tax=Ancylobacter sp. SL191 TaxID=2995166 RepID=UPI00226E0DD2|nr:hypothetical protein [Ancylobacter sp. SL191]WAC26349.1 hypothetical protein OU996_15185 [Ancylobacter sp. SL191]